MTNWYKKAQEFEVSSDEEVSLNPRWIPVDSSFITHVSYNENLEIFEVKLRNGTQYTYINVPKDVYNDFMDAESKGRFFNDVIKKYKISGAD